MRNHGVWVTICHEVRAQWVQISEKISVQGKFLAPGRKSWLQSASTEHSPVLSYQHHGALTKTSPQYLQNPFKIGAWWCPVAGD